MQIEPVTVLIVFFPSLPCVAARHFPNERLAVQTGCATVRVCAWKLVAVACRMCVYIWMLCSCGILFNGWKLWACGICMETIFYGVSLAFAVTRSLREDNHRRQYSGGASTATSSNHKRWW